MHNTGDMKGNIHTPKEAGSKGK